MKKFLIILFFISTLFKAQVVLDSVFVMARFDGVFNKTIIELYPFNSSEKDSAEFLITFRINKNSIVENLRLEIDNKLQKDITVSKVAGGKIYGKIVGKRIDPAYLIKLSDGSYLLRVFPISKNQRRKVIIEYYSILGGKEKLRRKVRQFKQLRNRKHKTKEQVGNDSLWWFVDFQKEPNHKAIKLTSVQPRRTVLDISKIDSMQSVIEEYNNDVVFQKYSSNNVNDYALSFNYKKTNSITKYKNDSLIFYCTNIPGKSTKNYYKTVRKINQSNISPPEFIKHLIENFKKFENETLYFDKTRYACNSFLEDMLEYIAERKSQKFKIKLRYFTNRNDFPLWFYADSVLVTEKLLFSLNPPNNFLSKKYVEIECPYINKFFEYSKILYENQAKQIASGFLTENLSKIVIADDSNAQSIKENILERENFGKLPPLNKGEPVYFIAVEKMPEIVGGLDTVYSQLFFPSFADTVVQGERIFIKVTVNKVGEIICTKILRSKNEIFSQIGVLALTLVKWLPGKNNKTPITVDVAVPLVFNKDTLITTNEKKYFIDKRNYIATLDNDNLVLFEEGFNYNKAENIKFRTEGFYNLLFNYPDIINIVYKMMYLNNIKKLGLKVNAGKETKDVLICR